ncbi:NYN domain-containing protein [Aeromicrobium sp. SMF47]|nr:NYN domain-containing protein [Aeromicrobium yanjiei]
MRRPAGHRGLRGVAGGQGGRHPRDRRRRPPAVRRHREGPRRRRGDRDDRVHARGRRGVAERGHLRQRQAVQGIPRHGIARRDEQPRQEVVLEGPLLPGRGHERRHDRPRGRRGPGRVPRAAVRSRSPAHRRSDAVDVLRRCAHDPRAAGEGPLRPDHLGLAQGEPPPRHPGDGRGAQLLGSLSAAPGWLWCGPRPITDNLDLVTSRNVAVFIDAENLFKGYGKLDIPDLSMADILDQLERAAAREAGAGDIALARAYADWGALGLEDFRRDVERAGVQTMQVFSVSKAEKNAADIVLVVDCLRAAADLEQLEVFIIVSADGDFVPLVRRLHELDKYVIGATLSDHPVNNVLEQEVDQYVPLKVKPTPPAAALQPIFSGDPSAKLPTGRPVRSDRPRSERPARRAEQAKSEPAVTESAVTEPVKGERAPRRAVKHEQPRGGAKISWHEMAKEIEVIHEGPATSPEDYKAIIKQILSDPKVRSFCDQLANQGGTLPILAMAIKAAAPRISPSDAKVSSMSRALRFALADTQYALARESDDTQPVLVRRANNPAGMLTDLSLDDIQRGVQ